MSSLPPYNPPPGRREAWLLAASAPSDLPAGLDGAPQFDRVVVADAALAPALRALGGPEAEVIADASGVVPGDGALLVAAPQPYVEAVLRALMGMPSASARLVILPGRPTVVQLLPDRGLLLRLNPGGALG